VFGHLSEGRGHIPHQWFADEIARLDTVAGDVPVIAGRIAATRIWAYIAQRADWLAEPAHWAARTAALEERLSDALHASLTQRFVDKRTTALMRQIGADAASLPVVIGPEGEVMVEDHPIGRLDGFRFTVAADARASDKRLLLAAAEKRLTGERTRRAQSLVDAGDGDIHLDDDAQLVWAGHAVARLASGASFARPRLVLDRSLDCLEKSARDRIETRLASWLATMLARRLGALTRLADASRDAKATPALRIVAGAIEAAGGITPRLPLRLSLDAIDADERKWLRKIGITIGALDLFDPRLMKPEAARWRRALATARGGDIVAPRDGATVLARGSDGATLEAGFRPLGLQAVRVDLVERIARAAHDARQGRTPFAPDPALATSIGLDPASLDRLMAELGFKALAGDTPRWVWRGRPPARPVPPAPVDPSRANAFAGLAALVRHG